MNKQTLPNPPEDAIDFGEMGHSLGLLLRLAQVRVFEIFFEKLAHHGLKPGEFTMLWLIGLNPDTRQGDIARRIRIKPAHMTKLVGRAVDADLVTRVVPDDDRRSVRLRLTAQGERFVADKKREFMTYLAEENIGLSDRDFGELVRLLRVFNGMEEAQ
ncbi:MAG: MarR family transcriptional regulator [Silicimonas sp.]